MDNFSDGQKSCLGFTALIAAVSLGVVALFSFWLGKDFRTGLIAGVIVFFVFFLIAVFFFLKIQNTAWIPAIVSGIYAILPDLIAGPEDDAIALLIGALITGILAWRKDRQSMKSLDAPEAPEELPPLID